MEYLDLNVIGFDWYLNIYCFDKMHLKWTAKKVLDVYFTPIMIYDLFQSEKIPN